MVGRTGGEEWIGLAGSLVNQGRLQPLEEAELLELTLSNNL